MNKQISILILFLLSFLNMIAQSEYAQLKSNIIAHSPEADAMAKYTALPVTLYSGMPNISVPVYSLKTARFNLPISLSYNYNGYKPMEEASSVGLGWSVQGSGVITRIIKGVMDENDASIYHYDDFLNLSMLNFKQEILADIAQGHADAEPDLYIFNFNGHSGKFILVKGKAYLFPAQNLRIDPYGEGFQITTEEGDHYSFQDFEMTYHKNLQGDPYIPTHKSAWYLSQITSADKTDTINYSYTSYNYIQPDTYSENFITRSDQPSGGGDPIQRSINHGDHIASKVLNRINGKNVSVSFNPESALRLDQRSYGTAKALSTININVGARPVKTVRLTHGYFGTSGSLKLNEIIITGYPALYGSCDTCITIPASMTQKYSFEYQGTAGFNNTTKGIDWWGYSNGADGNQSLFPNNGMITPLNYQFGDRGAHISGSLNGILKKMTYPTGGYATFDWEQNKKGYYSITYSYQDTSAHKYVIYGTGAVNGIMTITDTFSLNGEQNIVLNSRNLNDNHTVSSSIPILKVYRVSDGNLMYSSPLPAYAPGTRSDTVYFPAGQYNYSVSADQANGESMADIYYKKILTTVYDDRQDAPGLRIKQISSFDNLTSVDTALIKIYQYNSGQLTAMGSIDSKTVHYNPCAGANEYWMTNYNAPNTSSLSGLCDNSFYYKEATEINRSGKSTGKTVYHYLGFGDYVPDIVLQEQDEYAINGWNNLLLKKSISSYSLVEKNHFNAFKSYMSETLAYGTGACPALYVSGDPYDLSIHTKIYTLSDGYALSSIYKLLNSTTDSLFDQNGMNPIVKKTNYYYDNPSHQLPSRKIENNSKGEQIVTQMKYPLDYSFSTCGKPFDLDSNFLVAKSNAESTYNSCSAARWTALQPYYPAGGSTYNSILAQYPCEANFLSASSTVFANQASAYSSYISCLGTAITNSTIGWQKAVLLMQQNNIISPVIEQYVSIIKPGNNEYLLSATKNEFGVFNTIYGIQTALPVVIKQVETDGSILKSTFLNNPDNYYVPQVTYGYNNKLNLISQSKSYDVKHSYLWDYSNIYPVAEAVNADTSDIAYTSFEADGTGNWNFSGATTGDPLAPTGRHTYSLSGGNITKSVNSSLNYVVSLWAKNGTVTVNSGSSTKSGNTINSWTYYEFSVTNASTITVSGSAQIDELRLYPSSAQMTSYTYEPSIGMTSQSDMNGHISYYDYDSWGRLKLITDEQRKVIKVIDYELKQPVSN